MDQIIKSQEAQLCLHKLPPLHPPLPIVVQGKPEDEVVCVLDLSHQFGHLQYFIDRKVMVRAWLCETLPMPR